MRWLLALLLILLLAACGGDDDDDAATPTATFPAPATSPDVTPTTAASPEANASRQPGGTGVQPAASPTSAEPTPTRRPVTVVASPRIIARTPTPRQTAPEATETPAEEMGDGVTIVVDETFDDPASTTFFTGETDYGGIAAIESGLYTLTVPEGAWQSIVAVDTGDLGNAGILVEAGIQGDGSVGVVGRSVTNEDGSWTFYVCWLATDGRAGCHASIASEWYELFSVGPGTIQVLEVNELFLSIDGEFLYFDVNDVEVGTIADSSSPAGTWGVYAESFTGTSVAWYDRVTIALFDE